MQKITPCLWYNFNAEEAVDFYLSVFKDGKITNTSHYTKSSPGPEGKVLTIEFELFGQKYLALNGGPQFPHTNAVSFMVNCRDQKEIDYYWDKLMAGGGHPEQCGWLRDRFGVPWQIIWDGWVDMLGQANKEKADAYMAAMMKMVKIDIATLKKAGGSV